MASTTSYSQAGTSQRATHRRTNVGWISPSTQLPQAIISSDHGPALTNEKLRAIASSLSKLDALLLLYCQYYYEKIVQGEINQGDAAGQRLAQDELADLQMMTAQFQDIKSGRSVFSSLYLTERRILHYWGAGFSFLAQMLLVGDEIHQPTLGNLKRTTDLAAEIEIALLDAASDGVLVSDYRLVLSERWDLLERPVGLYHQHSQVPRTLATWPELSRRIQEAMEKHVPQKNNAALQAQSGKFTIILWLTFIGTTISNVATFALAYSHSEHSPGSTKDADFWFLLGGCITQGFTLIISCIPLKADSRLRKRIWVPPMILALTSTVIAPPLYVTTPTEWSSFVVLIATGIQAFMVLQLASMAG
ncbi:hypothetical protein FAVG1_10603 [Fusarium avenaceum]|nr:hypothetical protein FAVG1_10603 [Fusarium avenaceum]